MLTVPARGVKIGYTCPEQFRHPAGAGVAGRYQVVIGSAGIFAIAWRDRAIVASVTGQDIETLTYAADIVS